MRHGKRSVLTTEDINAALRLRNVEARPARNGWQRSAACPRVAPRAALPPRLRRTRRLARRAAQRCCRATR